MLIPMISWVALGKSHMYSGSPYLWKLLGWTRISFLMHVLFPSSGILWIYGSGFVPFHHNGPNVKLKYNRYGKFFQGVYLYNLMPENITVSSLETVQASSSTALPQACPRVSPSPRPCSQLLTVSSALAFRWQYRWTRKRNLGFEWGKEKNKDTKSKHKLSRRASATHRQYWKEKLSDVNVTKASSPGHSPGRGVY